MFEKVLGLGWVVWVFGNVVEQVHVLFDAQLIWWNLEFLHSRNQGDKELEKQSFGIRKGRVDEGGKAKTRRLPGAIFNPKRKRLFKNKSSIPSEVYLILTETIWTKLWRYSPTTNKSKRTWLRFRTW